MVVGRWMCGTWVSTGPIMHQSSAQYTYAKCTVRTNCTPPPPLPSSMSEGCGHDFLFRSTDYQSDVIISMNREDHIQVCIWDYSAPILWALAAKWGMRDSTNAVKFWFLVFMEYDSFSTQHTNPLKHEFTQQIFNNGASSLPANTLSIIQTGRKKSVLWISVSKTSFIPNNNNLQHSVSW